jgi:hypothetical protein
VNVPAVLTPLPSDPPPPAIVYVIAISEENGLALFKYEVTTLTQDCGGFATQLVPLQ